MVFQVLGVLSLVILVNFPQGGLLGHPSRFVHIRRENRHKFTIIFGILRHRVLIVVRRISLACLFRILCCSFGLSCRDEVFELGFLSIQLVSKEHFVALLLNAMLHDYLCGGVVLLCPTLLAASNQFV